MPTKPRPNQVCGIWIPVRASLLIPVLLALSAVSPAGVFAALAPTNLNTISGTASVSGVFIATATLTEATTALPLLGKLIDFNLQGVIKSTFTNSFGIANVSYTVPVSTGLYIYSAQFAGDGTYAASGSTASILVGLRSAGLAGNPVTTQAASTFTASAALTDNITASPISGKVVLFSFQTSTQTGITDGSGIARVTYMAPASTGVYNYTASFAGDSVFAAGSDNANSVTVGPVDVTAPVSRVTNPANGSQVSALANIAGTAGDAGGVAQVRVSVRRWSDGNYWGGGSWISTETWNAASGTATWTYAGITGAALTNGATYLAMSKAYDLSGNISNPFSSSSTFTYTSFTTTITYLAAGPASANLNAIFTASATLVHGITLFPIPEKTISFLFQGSGLTAVTNSSGIASVTYTAPASSGVYNYTASFAGDAAYLASVDNVNSVTVTGDGIPPSARITNPASGSQVSALSGISGTAYDETGLAQVRVSLKRWSDGNYWGGGSWISTETWNAASGTSTWTYAGITGAALTDGATYLAMSKAYDLAGNISSPFSSSSTFTYVAAAPAQLTWAPLTSVGSGGLTINWGSTYSTGTVYSVRLTTQIAEAPFIFSATTTALSYAVAGLNPNTNYYAYVSTISGFYQLMGSSATLAAAPSSVSFALVGFSSAALTWSAGLNPSWTTYQYQVSVSSSFGVLASSGSGTGTTGLLTGLAEGTTYYGRARAVNLGGVASAYGDAPGQAVTLVQPGILSTTLAALNVSAAANNVFTASATLTDALTAPLQGKTILFAFQGSTQTAVTNSIGIAAVSYTAPGATGSYNYTASFGGDSWYAASSDTANTVTVGLRATTAIGQVATTQVNAVFSANAMLADDITASPIAGKTVLFGFQGSTQAAVTNGSGIATVSYIAPASSGVYNFTTSFGGDALYAASSDLANAVTVGPRPTITAGQAAATQASSVFAAVAALSDTITAGPVPGKSVSFDFQGSVQTAVTNSSGIATVSYTAPASSGVYNYTASFGGDAMYAASGDSTNTITVGLRPTGLIAQNTAIQAAAVFTATATLTDSLTAGPVSGKFVLFTFQSSTQTAVTNSSGIAAVSYTAPGTTGTYNYTASFTGDSAFAASSDLANTVSAGLRPTALAAQNVTTRTGAVFTATATLTDELSSGVVPGKSINFVFQGLTHTAVTNSSGTATTTYTAPASSSAYNYTASFAGDAGYGASSDLSNTVTTMPLLPAQPGVPAGAALGVSSISWTWASLGGVSGYRVYFAASTSSLIGSTLVPAYAQAGLSPNTTYGIVVAGVNESGEGLLSVAAISATLANAPSGAAAAAVFATSAAFNWNLNGNPSGTTAKILRVNTNTTFTTLNTSYTDTGLLGCTTYTFRIWNVNRSNIATQYGEVGPLVTGNPLPLPPGNLSAQSLSGNRIYLAWEPAPFEGITGYKLYYDNGTGAIDYATPLASLSSGQTSFVADVPTSSAAYKFGLRAVHRCGSQETNTGVRATAASLYSLTGVRAAIKIPQSGKKVDGNSVTVMAELVTGTAAETKNILLQYKASASGAWQNIVPRDPGNHPNPDSTSPYFIHWDVTGLAPGSYDLRAVATDLGNASDPSPAAVTIAVDPADSDIHEDDSGGKIRKEQKVSNLVLNTLQAADADSAQVTKVEIPAGALDESTVTVSVTNNPAAIPPAPSDAEAAGIITEISFSNNQSALAGGQTAVVTLLFPDANNDGILDGTNLRASQLEMYSAHTLAGPWLRDLSSTVDLANKKVIGRTSHFSFFALFAPQAANLNSAVAYPVPWKPGSGGRFDSAPGTDGIGFYSLTDKTEVRIYTINGQLVRELKLTAADLGVKIWDGRNSAGLKAASGVYLAHIKSGSSVKTLKIAVER